MEVWKDIPGYGDHYQASNLGKVRVKNRSVTKFYKLLKLEKRTLKK